MHTQLRKIPYTPDQKKCFSVIITDRRKSHEKPIQHHLRVDALSAAAAEYQALRSYLLPYKAEEQERLINNELVTASVLMDVDKDGRIVPFDDKRYSGLGRVALLVFMTLLICAGLWLVIAGLSQVFDILNAAVNPIKSG